MENRFGEMTKDNIFMKKSLQQALQLATVSYSYELGTIREIGGGALDMFTGKALGMKSSAWSPRANYIIALPITTGIMAAMYQYMKTGKHPESMMDLLAPQTGGTTLEGQPERISPVGYMKDLHNVLSDPRAWAENKANPLIGIVQGMATGNDWKGQPLAVSPDGKPTNSEWIGRMLNLVGDAFTPIPLEGDVNPKSTINRWQDPEWYGGLRNAGQQYTKPEQQSFWSRKHAIEAFRRKHKSDTKHYGGSQ
jgi:hypothetical protein